jgi:hypothetical protein
LHNPYNPYNPYKIATDKPTMKPLSLDANGIVSQPDTANHKISRKQVELCKRWLLTFTERCQVGHETGWYSYGLKHSIECGADTYISNGALIQAAQELGIEIHHQTHPRTVNAWLGVKLKRDYRKLWDYRGGRGFAEKVGRGWMTAEIQNLA